MVDAGVWSFSIIKDIGLCLMENTLPYSISFPSEVLDNRVWSFSILPQRTLGYGAMVHFLEKST